MAVAPSISGGMKKWSTEKERFAGRHVRADRISTVAVRMLLTWTSRINDVRAAVRFRESRQKLCARALVRSPHSSAYCAISIYARDARRICSELGDLMYRTTTARKANGVYVCAAFGILCLLCAPAWGDTRGAVKIAGPAGWTQVPKSAFAAEPSILSAWIAPADAVSPFRQNVNIVKAVTTTGSLTNDVAGNLSEVERVEPSVTVSRNQVNKRCRANSSQIVWYSLERNGLHLVAEQVYTLTSGGLFIATYSRDSAQPPVSAARNAVEGMCPQ
jgi:hypothetical protein